MQVLVAVILAIGSASALGSGPYLPSGWRPQGPAFYLPSEVQKPADSPLKEVILVESEASGSEGLREYGPPNDDSLNIVQTLPDVVTEQAFLVERAELKAVEPVQDEEKAELEVITGTATEAQVLDARSQNIEIEAATAPAVEEIDVVVVTESADVVQEIEPTASVVTEALQNIAQEQIVEVTQTPESLQYNAQEELVQNTPIVEVQTTIEENVETAPLVESEKIIENIDAQTEQNISQEKASQVAFEQNIAEEVIVEKAAPIVIEALEKIVQENAEDVIKTETVVDAAAALVNLDNEIKSAQIQQIANIESELKNQEGSASVQVPEGFLEYGPPGFTEYGPPKVDPLLRSEFESNEVRRRRFSPKFRSSKTTKH